MPKMVLFWQSAEKDGFIVRMTTYCHIYIATLLQQYFYTVMSKAIGKIK